jgi:hypothetical protein
VECEDPLLENTEAVYTVLEVFMTTIAASWHFLQSSILEPEMHGLADCYDERPLLVINV